MMEKTEMATTNYNQPTKLDFLSIRNIPAKLLPIILVHYLNVSVEKKNQDQI